MTESTSTIKKNKQKKLRKLRSGHFKIYKDTENDINNKNNENYIYMNENLTPTNRRALKEARQIAKAKK